MPADASRRRLDAWRDRRLAPLSFTLDGVRYEIPEHPARVWVLAIVADEPTDLLLNVLSPADAEGLWEDALDEDCDLTPDLLHRIGLELETVAGGRPWWQVHRLVATLVDQWDAFIGIARDRGLGDPLEWPLDELCAWVYLRLTRDAKEEEKARIDADLFRPPMVADMPDEWVDEWVDEDSGWLAAAAQLGVPLDE